MSVIPHHFFVLFESPDETWSVIFPDMSAVFMVAAVSMVEALGTLCKDDLTV